MSAAIASFYLSLMWAETVGDLYGSSQPTGPLGYLGNDIRYKVLFDNIRLGNSPLPGLERPWPKPSGQRFWTYYLNEKTPGDASGQDAWLALVPLRQRLPAPNRQRTTAGWMQPELFLYPYGLALVMTIAVQEPLSLTEFARTANELRFAPVFTTTNGAAKQIAAVAADVLTQQRNQQIGTTAMSGSRSMDPFTVLTVVRGDVQPTAPNAGSDRKSVV